MIIFLYLFIRFAFVNVQSPLYISHDDCCHNAQNKLNSRQSFRFIQNLKTFFPMLNEEKIQTNKIDKLNWIIKLVFM